MNNLQFESEKNYQVSVVIAKNMLDNGLINDKEFKKIKGFLVKKYCPIIGGL